MLSNLFLKYPYKTFQQFVQLIDSAKMADVYAQAFAKEKHQYLCGDAQEPSGAAALSSFSDFTRRFGLNFFLLKSFNALDEKSADELAQQITSEKQADFIIARSAVDDSAAVCALTKAGFYYVCGESIYSLDLSKSKIDDVAAESKIRRCEEKDFAACRSILTETHSEIRYLYDPWFDRQKVIDAYGDTVESSFRNSKHAVFVFEDAGIVRGFITLIVNESLAAAMNCGFGWGSLDYIAVEKSTQGRDAGLALNSFALKYLRSKNIRIVSVKTMANNYKAQRLLVRSGFIQSSINLVLHWRRGK